jgi:hypothetical protein
MKLKTYNTTNIQTLSNQLRKPYLQVNTTTGLFNINKEAAELIGAGDGDQIQFHQDEDEPLDWYIEKVKKDGFVIRFKENVGKGFLFNSSKLARKIFDSVNCTEKSGRIFIGEEIIEGKQKLFTLVTAHLTA